MNTLFQFPEYVKQLQEIRHTCNLKQFVRQIPKTHDVGNFSFNVICPSSYNFKCYYSF